MHTLFFSFVSDYSAFSLDSVDYFNFKQQDNHDLQILAHVTFFWVQQKIYFHDFSCCTETLVCSLLCETERWC